MQAIEVGKLLQEGKTRYPEVPKFDFDQAGGVLYVFFKSPSQAEIDAFRSGAVKLGLFYKDDIILCFLNSGICTGLTYHTPAIYPSRLSLAIWRMTWDTA